MFDRRLDEIWVMRYRQGQLSAEDELWTESCYDSEQSVRELFGQLRVIPLHLQDGSDLAVEDDDPAVSDASLLLQIDDELRRLEELVTASKSRPALLRGRLLSVPLARGGRSLPGSVAASATSAAAAAVPERAAPTGRLSCEYEFAGADRTKIVLRFRGPLGVVGGGRGEGGGAAVAGSQVSGIQDVCISANDFRGCCGAGHREVAGTGTGTSTDGPHCCVGNISERGISEGWAGGGSSRRKQEGTG